MENIKEYTNGELTIVWKPNLCIHAAVCVKTLPQVYNPKERPWIKQDNATTQQLVDQISKCPSGALSYYYNKAKEQNTTEKIDKVAGTSVEVAPNGPYIVKGDFEVKDSNGSKIETNAVAALCRCGASAKKPFCDGSHVTIGFDDSIGIQKAVESSTQKTDISTQKQVVETTNVYQNSLQNNITNPDKYDDEFSATADSIFENSAELVRKIIPSHQSGISVTYDGTWNTLKKYFSLSEKYKAYANYTTKAKGTGIHNWIMGQQGTVRLTQKELENHPEWKGFGDEAGKHPPMNGWLAKPIIDSKGKTWGVVQLSDRLEGDYTEFDEKIFDEFVELLVISLEQAWSLRNEKQQNKK